MRYAFRPNARSASAVLSVMSEAILPPATDKRTSITVPAMPALPRIAEDMGASFTDLTGVTYRRSVSGNWVALSSHAAATVRPGAR